MPNKRPRSYRKFCKELRAKKTMKALDNNHTTDIVDNKGTGTDAKPLPFNYDLAIHFFDTKIIKCYELDPEKQEFVCPHVVVSSALIYKFLFGKFSLIDVHQIYFTGVFRTYGRMAKNFVFNKVKKLKKAFCVYSDMHPWICASPDGLIG
jgi:hypothetical protein